MSKAVITILGTIKCDKKAKYEIDSNLKEIISLKNDGYTNMLPILLENFSKTHDIVPIYTQYAKEVQTKVLQTCEKTEIDIDEMFKKGVFIENENDFKEILKAIDNKIREYDEVIVDVSHGFRHLPILMTIDLIITSLKSINSDKVKLILFAEEIIYKEKYKIVDLSEYIELAKLAFIINVFGDNYSVSNHIIIKKNEFKEVVDLMRKFSKDLMGLSIDTLLGENGSAFRLIKKLEELEKSEINLFEDEIKKIKEKLKRTYSKKPHQYQTFYYIAEDVASEERGYLAVAISLIFEGVSYYLLYVLKHSSKKLKVFFDELEKRINYQITYYDILDLCRSVFLFNKERLRVSYKIRDLLTDEIKNELYLAKKRILNRFGVFNFKKHPLIKLINDSRNLRNNLLHANSGGRIENVNNEVKNLLNEYKEVLRVY
jgi:CRISPR-associated DxTHG motif protein